MKPPQADVDALARWIYTTQARMAGLHVPTWDQAHPRGLARSRHLARAMLKDPPPVLQVYVRLQMAQEELP